MYLVQLKNIISEVKETIENGTAQGKILKELASFLPKMKIDFFAFNFLL
jgi:hypothetical protein